MSELFKKSNAGNGKLLNLLARKVFISGCATVSLHEYVLQVRTHLRDDFCVYRSGEEGRRVWLANRRQFEKKIYRSDRTESVR